MNLPSGNIAGNKQGLAYIVHRFGSCRTRLWSSQSPLTPIFATSKPISKPRQADPQSYSSKRTLSVSDALEKALQLRSGLRAWLDSDRYLRDRPPAENPRLQKTFRDNWDARIGTEKFGGVWSIPAAKKNLRHPASKEALKISRENWSRESVTVDHAIPVKILFALFWGAETPDDMQTIIDAYAVAVITTEENSRLNATGLRADMPDGWKLGDDPLARWNQANIQVSGLHPQHPSN